MREPVEVSNIPNVWMRNYLLRYAWLALSVSSLALASRAQVVISEIMYHPVERPAFNANGSPVLDLYEDVHEFIEIHNAGANAIQIGGWKIAGGIQYTVPPNLTLQPGEYRVVARNPSRLAAVSAYALDATLVLGPFTNQLSNSGETIRLQNAAGDLVDSVRYSAESPWAISADGLGANEDFTGVDPLQNQYRGRSLERVSFTHPSNDPANWLASPLPGNPSPGRANAVNRPVPKPVVVRFSVAQNTDEAAIIRHNQPVRIDCAFSASDALSDVSVEWFVEDVNVTNEPRSIAPMSPEGPPQAGQFTVVLPGRPDRTIVRYRFRANRGAGDEVVSPRPDDPFQWHAYFVTPVRTSSRPMYDCFISSASLARLQSNIERNPRRVTAPDPPGTPRASWNATEPAIMVHEGVVYDMRMRHHGSRYNRRASRSSFKWQFPRYKKFNGVTGIFETDKGNDFIVGHNLFIEAGLPASNVRYVDLYLNNNGVIQRLEQGEFDGDMLDAYHQAQQRLNPGSELEPTGEIYKSVGTIDLNGEGPYGRGDGRRLAKPPHWTDLQMYEWTYALQNNGWRGSYAFKEMIDAFWVARGDTPGAPNPNIPAMRGFFSRYFDIDEMLTYIAVENWACPWDDTTQNHFLWQRRSGKWGMLPWDCDAWFGRGDNTPASSSIYIGEVGDRSNNFRGPNFFKDGFIKAFREEYKQRLYLLNNTFLHPDNITAMGFGSIRSFADQRFAAVNQQCGYGPFQRPNKPRHAGPANNGTALPPSSLRASAYTHTAGAGRPHAKTVWEIRSASGSYREPLWKVTSATNLTSIALPFERLSFGETYFWRCTYLDADGHPSVASDETSFTYGAAPSQVALIALDPATSWKYNQTANLDGVNWTAPGFDDSAWPSGPALLARETAALPEPIRTTLNIGRSAYYFRKRFTFPSTPQGASLRLRHVIDDGCVIYLNGAEVLRTAMPGGAVNYGTISTRTVGDAVYEGPFTIPASSLVQGENVLAVEVHQVAANSSDIVFGLSLEATVAAVTGDVALNEIAARNRGSVVNGNTAPDWIELFNNSSQTIDLGGMSLSDDVLVPGKYIFPPNTLIAAQGYLVVWCDREMPGSAGIPAGGLHTGFALNDKGQTVALFGPTADGVTVRDYVTFGLQISDSSIGRVADGSGGWQLTTPTPGQANRPVPLGSASGLKVNEWMASPVSGDDWFELFNSDAQPVALGGLYLTDNLSNPTNTRIGALSFMAPFGFVEFLADENPENGANHARFKLSAGGESIYLIATNGVSTIDSVTFGPQVSGVSQGRLPDGQAAIVSFPSTPSPAASNRLPIGTVVINEVLSHSDPPLEDAIELHNTTASPVDIGGWFLSDDADRLKKFRIPDGTVLPPGGFKVFYEFQFNADTNSPASFSLNSARGDDVYLSVADANGNLTGYREHVDFGAAENDVSFGRHAAGDRVVFTALSRRTFGADNPSSVDEFRSGPGLANAPPRIGPVIISEIMYHPAGEAAENRAHEEFIELHNVTGAPVPLFDPANPGNTWRLRDAVEFDFPPKVTLPARGYVVVVNFNPGTDAERSSAFQSRYGGNAVLIGPYGGRLDNEGEDLKLYKPDPPQTAPGADFVFAPYILVDRVDYSDDPPWPMAADGAGSSLQRVDALTFGNDPANWFADGFTPGAAHSPQDPNQDIDSDGLPDAWEIAHDLIVGVNDAHLDADGDGMTNAQEFAAGTDPKEAASVLKLEASVSVGTITLRFLAQPDKAYAIQMRPRLTAGDWQTFSTISAALSSQVVERTQAVTSEAERYYRVVTVP
jgi:hypothetical protein